MPTTFWQPQNFWGAMQSQGAPNIQGDAFMTKYQDRSPLTLNGVDAAQDPDAYFDPLTYYNYGVDIPANATNGEVWLFDPGFCEVSTSQGTGESWTVGGSNGYSSAQPVSAFYELYDKIDPPYSPSDVPVASSGNTFKDLSLDDATLGGSNGSGSCQGLAWHDGWWRLASGLTGGPDGTTYRLHTHTDGSDQNNTTALNAFAIWATATGGTPNVYGNGAMEAYVRLPGGQASEFYLAQIASVHAGKTMQIDLWDPGDTGALSASLQILQPTSSGFAPASFTYSTSRGTTDSNASLLPRLRKRDIRDDQHGRQLVVQRVLAAHHDRPRRQLQRTDAAGRDPGRVVEDQVHDGGLHLKLQHRPHHLEGPDPRQPGPPDRPVGARLPAPVLDPWWREGVASRSRSCEAVRGGGADHEVQSTPGGRGQ